MNKVFLASLVLAVLIAVTPYLQGDALSWYNIGFAATTAIAGYLTRNWKGQIASIIGVVGAGLMSFWQAHPEPTGLDVQYILTRGLLPLAIQVLGAWIGPVNTEQKEG